MEKRKNLVLVIVGTPGRVLPGLTYPAVWCHPEGSVCVEYATAEIVIESAVYPSVARSLRDAFRESPRDRTVRRRGSTDPLRPCGFEASSRLNGLPCPATVPSASRTTFDQAILGLGHALPDVVKLLVNIHLCVLRRVAPGSFTLSPGGKRSWRSGTYYYGR